MAHRVQLSSRVANNINKAIINSRGSYVSNVNNHRRGGTGGSAEIPKLCQIMNTYQGSSFYEVRVYDNGIYTADTYGVGTLQFSVLSFLPELPSGSFVWGFPTMAQTTIVEEE